MCIDGTKSTYRAFLLSPIVTKYATYFNKPLRGAYGGGERPQIRVLKSHIESVIDWVERVRNEPEDARAKSLCGSMAKTQKTYLDGYRPGHSHLDLVAYLGCFFHYFDSDLQKYAINYAHDPEAAIATQRREHADAYTEFPEVFGLIVPEDMQFGWNRQLPDGLYRVVHREYGELDRERLNRLWLLCWAMNVETAPTRWRALKKDNDKKSYSAHPTWWNEDVPDETSRSSIDADMPPKAYHDFKCTLIAACNEETEADITYMEQRFGTKFKRDLQNCPNPSAYADLRDWRNDIRAELQLAKFGFDLSGIAFVIDYNDGRAQVYESMMAQEIMYMRNKAFRIFISDPHIKTLTLKYCLNTALTTKRELGRNSISSRALLSVQEDGAKVRGDEEGLVPNNMTVSQVFSPTRQVTALRSLSNTNSALEGLPPELRNAIAKEVINSDKPFLLNRDPRSREGAMNSNPTKNIRYWTDSLHCCRPVQSFVANNCSTLLPVTSSCT